MLKDADGGFRTHNLSADRQPPPLDNPCPNVGGSHTLKKNSNEAVGATTFGKSIFSPFLIFGFCAQLFPPHSSLAGAEICRDGNRFHGAALAVSMRTLVGEGGWRGREGVCGWRCRAAPGVGFNNKTDSSTRLSLLSLLRYNCL